ncbi:MAG TPA: hypothetical protein HA346_01410 [Thermoplasmata archaeon]|nr:hypothetical protein [Thermoplasmata archaeon]
MRLRTLLGLMLVIFVVVPLVNAGSFAYTKSHNIVCEITRQDLKEKMDFCLRTCEFYNEKVKKGELTQEEAISEIATLLVGSMGGGGTRDESKSLGKGKSGHINGINSDGTWVIQRRREGKNIEDLYQPKIEGSLGKNYESCG